MLRMYAYNLVALSDLQDEDLLLTIANEFDPKISILHILRILLVADIASFRANFDDSFQYFKDTLQLTI